MAGNFSNAFPPEYLTTVGTDISTLELYFQNFPDIVATLLKIHLDKLVISKLKQYKKKTKEILEKADTILLEEEREKFRTQCELQQKAWAAKLLVFKSRLTAEQLDILDGKLAECEKQIRMYCELVVVDWEKVHLLQFTFNS